MIHRCAHCGKLSFKPQHPDCAAAAAAQSTIKRAVLETVRARRQPESLKKLLAASRLAAEDTEDAICQGIWAATNEVLEDGVLSLDEEAAMAAVVQAVPLPTQPDAVILLDRALQRLRAASTVRRLDAGEPVEIKAPPQLLLKGNERAVFQFGHVRYLKEQRIRTGRGTSQGISLRLAKGVSYRIGEFDYRPVETTQMQDLDQGTLILTTKGLHVVGEKIHSIKWSSLAGLIPKDDGVELQRSEGGLAEAIAGADGWAVLTVAKRLAG